MPREGFATAKDDYSKAIHQQCLITDPTTPEHEGPGARSTSRWKTRLPPAKPRSSRAKTAREISASVPGNLNGNRDASWLFNGRLSPVVPYAIRGAIWNQGYANAGEGLPYYNNLHSLVRGWRIVWDKPELPVYFHQFYSAGMKPRQRGQQAQHRSGPPRCVSAPGWPATFPTPAWPRRSISVVPSTTNARPFPVSDWPCTR